MRGLFYFRHFSVDHSQTCLKTAVFQKVPAFLKAIFLERLTGKCYLRLCVRNFVSVKVVLCVSY